MLGCSNALDESLAAAEVLGRSMKNSRRWPDEDKEENLCDVRSEHLDFTLLHRTVRKAGQDMLCVEFLEGGY